MKYITQPGGVAGFAIRVGVAFTLMAVTCLAAIMIANGELTKATGSLMLAIVLLIGLVVGTWAIVHNQFPKPIEIGITGGIVLGIIGMAVLLLFSGTEIKQALKDLCETGSAWWLGAPVVGTALIIPIFGLHRKRG